MLRPTPEEVLKSISYTFDTLIRPDPTSTLAVSYSLTVSNMLRQLLLTLQHEEGLITVDTADLRAVLEQASRFLTPTETGAAIIAEIDTALAFTPSGPAQAQAARQNWRALRGVLERTISHLQAVRERYGKRDDYRSVRQAIRDYLDRSLDRESVLIDGAFTLARR